MARFSPAPEQGMYLNLFSAIIHRFSMCLPGTHTEPIYELLRESANSKTVESEAISEFEPYPVAVDQIGRFKNFLERRITGPALSLFSRASA
jgi:hypothetical protein